MNPSETRVSIMNRVAFKDCAVSIQRSLQCTSKESEDILANMLMRKPLRSLIVELAIALEK